MTSAMLAELSRLMWCEANHIYDPDAPDYVPEWHQIEPSPGDRCYLMALSDALEREAARARREQAA